MAPSTDTRFRTNRGFVLTGFFAGRKPRQPHIAALHALELVLPALEFLFDLIGIDRGLRKRGPGPRPSRKEGAGRDEREARGPGACGHRWKALK